MASAENTPTISHVQEAVLYVSDLDRSAAFYSEVLGLPQSAAIDEARFMQTGENSTLILFKIAEIEARDSPIPSHGATGPAHVCFGIAPDERDAWRKRLKDHGVAIEHEHDWPLGTHSIYFRDPDGHSIELMDNTHYRKVWDRLKKG